MDLVYIKFSCLVVSLRVRFVGSPTVELGWDPLMINFVCENINALYNMETTSVMRFSGHIETFKICKKVS